MYDEKNPSGTVTPAESSQRDSALAVSYPHSGNRQRKSTSSDIEFTIAT